MAAIDFQMGGSVRHANRNGCGNEVDEPQQTSFSWAEFIAAGPVGPRCRKSKPQPATASLFEWSLSRFNRFMPVFGRCRGDQLSGLFVVMARC